MTGENKIDSIFLAVTKYWTLNRGSCFNVGVVYTVGLQ